MKNIFTMSTQLLNFKYVTGNHSRCKKSHSIRIFYLPGMDNRFKDFS